MAGMNDEVVIVILDEEIQGRKRVNNEEDGSKAVEWPIRVSRNLGITWFAQKIMKRLPKTASPPQADITWFAPKILKRCSESETPSSLQAGAGCDGEKRKEEVAVSDEVNRLRGLLAEGPKKLSEKDMDDVIQYLKVDEIVSVVLKSGQSEDYNMIGNNNRVDPYEPSAVEVVGLLTRVLHCIEKVEEADVWVLYRNFPYREFALLLLTAVDSHSKRCFGGEPLIKAEERDVIPYLCSVLPWELFAHVLSCKAQLPLLKPTIKEVADRKAAEEAKRKAEEAKKKAKRKVARSCRICLGKGKKKCIPTGATVGPDFWALCRCCHDKLTNPVTMCSDEGVTTCSCSEEGGYSFWLPKDLIYITGGSTSFSVQ